MTEEENGIYGKPNLKLIIGGFLCIIFVVLIAGWLFLRTGHPDMHTQPQPRDNKGALTLRSGGSDA